MSDVSVVGAPPGRLTVMMVQLGDVLISILINTSWLAWLKEDVKEEALALVPEGLSSLCSSLVSVHSVKLIYTC